MNTRRRLELQIRYSKTRVMQVAGRIYGLKYVTARREKGVRVCMNERVVRREL